MALGASPSLDKSYEKNYNQNVMIFKRVLGRKDG